MIKDIGKFCKDFRTEILDVKLIDFSEMNGLNFKNVSAFEHGRANNIKYLVYYYDLANEEQKDLFTSGIFNVL